MRARWRAGAACVWVFVCVCVLSVPVDVDYPPDLPTRDVLSHSPRIRVSVPPLYVQHRPSRAVSSSAAGGSF